MTPFVPHDRDQLRWLFLAIVAAAFLIAACAVSLASASGIAAAQPPEPKGLAEGKSPAPAKTGETPKANPASIKVVEVSNG